MANYQGTSGRDTYNGTSVADQIYGYGDNDTLAGAGGDDLIDGGDGDDAMSGEAGNDTLYSIAGTDRLVDGGIGDDTIWIGSRSGALFSAFRANVLAGGAGRDTLSMYGNATFQMGSFNAAEAGFEIYSNVGYSITATEEVNRFDFSALSTNSTYGIILNALGGADTISGTTGNDIVNGGSDNDVLVGNAGNDSLTGESGEDRMLGGDGIDSISGGDANDTLDGGNDGDSLNGGSGDDIIAGGDGNDTLDGVDGSDSQSGGAGNDVIYSYDGADTKLDGGSGDDTVYLGSRGAVSTLNANVLAGGAGTDTLYLYGNVNFAMANFNAADTAVEILTNVGYTIVATEVANRYDFSAWMTNSTYGAIVNGLGGADVLTGTSGSDVFNGGADNDVLIGNAGNDILTGEAGEDRILGGDGIDSISGGADADTIDGGNDGDSLNGGSGDDIITGGDGNDTIDGVDGNDSQSGGAGNDVIYSYDGTDTKLDGGIGDDTVYLGSRGAVSTLNANVLVGGAGTDTLYLYGNVNFAMANFNAADTGVEVLTNVGYTISSTEAGNRYDFSAWTTNSTYGAIVNGLGGADVLTGTSGSDLFNGGADNDVLIGNAGNDSLTGEAGEDRLLGGDGIDTISGGADADTIDGGNDGDSLNGGSGDDTIAGGDGNDTIDGVDGNDSQSGGAGNDVIYSYDGADTKLDGGTGDDTIYLGSRGGVSTLNANALTGGAGTDTLYLYGNVNFAMANFNAADTGVEILTNVGYTISGTEAANRYDFSAWTTNSTYGAIVNGLGGADVLTGTSGSDLFNGGADNDVLFGNAGNDSLTGEAGEDRMLGGDGIDTISGGADADTIDGGNDGDSLNGGSGDDIISGGDGNDTIDGVDGSDSMAGGDGNDTIYAYDGVEKLIDGGTGDDTVYLGTRGAPVAGVSGLDLRFGTGTDTLYLYGAATITGTFVAVDAGLEILTNVGYVINGGASADVIDFTGVTANSTYGALLYGLDGNDSLAGTTAGDQLYGGDGDDLLEGGAGSDTVDGGAGVDRASYAGASGAVTVTLATSAQQDTRGAGFDTLVGIEGLVGSRFSDSLTGNAGDNTLVGLGGRDRLDGGDGIDVLQGGVGDDILIGGGARDVAVYEARWIDTGVTATASGYTVADLRGGSPDGTDALSTIELLRFANGTFAIADTINVGPEGVDDADAVKEAGVGQPGGVPVTGNLLANDTDANLLTAGLGEYLRVTAASAVDGSAQTVADATAIVGSYGTLTINSDGSYSYALAENKPSVDALGEGETVVDRFSYTLVDAHGLSSTAEIAITVTGTADTLARRDVLQVTIGAPSSLDAAVLLANDAAKDGTVISAISNVSGASVELVDGKLVIAIDGASGSFDYTLTAENGETSTARVDLAGVTYRGKAKLTADPAAAAVDFVGGASSDVLTGGDGADRLVGGDGADRLDGGAGIDRLEGGAGGDRYYVNDAQDVIVEGPEPGRDVVYATASAYTLVDFVENLTFVGAGDFVGTGNEAGNTIAGGAGDDGLSGAGGGDTLIGGLGDDVLDGGDGGDTASYADIRASVTVNLAVAGAQQTGGGGIDTLVSIENVIGGRDGDRLSGAEGANALYGGGGRDILSGGSGNDRLYGGVGGDRLTGGSGADGFYYLSIEDFNAIGATDTITDFKASQGDRIDLSAIDPDAVAEGDQAFTFIGDAAFTPGTGAFELRYTDNGGGSYTLEGDLNHDGTADFALHVVSQTPPAASDLIL